MGESSRKMSGATTTVVTVASTDPAAPWVSSSRPRRMSGSFVQTTSENATVLIPAITPIAAVVTNNNTA